MSDEEIMPPKDHEHDPVALHGLSVLADRIERLERLVDIYVVYFFSFLMAIMLFEIITRLRKLENG